MLDSSILVHLGRKLWSNDSIAKPVLAGLLALLLLAGTSLSIRHSAHGAFPGQGDAGHDLCLLCSFAKGQVNTSEATQETAFLVLVLFSPVLLLGTPPFLGFNYRISPGRAPPLV